MDEDKDREAYLSWLLSQMVDGELTKEQTQSLALILITDSKLAAKWRRWHLIKEILSSEEIFLRSHKTIADQSYVSKKSAL